MYRQGKLLALSFGLPIVGRNIKTMSFMRYLMSGIIHNSQNATFLGSSVHQDTLLHKNTKALNYLGIKTVQATKSMSTSVNEEFRHLDYNQLLELKNTPNNIIIDVREKHEVDETGVLPGAHHIPLGDIETALKTPEVDFKKKYNFEKPSTEDTVIFSCRSGKRSLAALEKALANGFKNAKHYKGGWLDWEKRSSESRH